MGFLDRFKRKKSLLTDFRPGMKEAECLDALPVFSKDFIGVVQRFSIRFYREIHSHEAGAFPGVRDEFFYLLFFATQSRFNALFGPESADRVIENLRKHLNKTFLGSDCMFNKEKFWAVYDERAATYAARQSGHSGSEVSDGMLSAFNGYLISRTDCWSRIVTHHSADVALEAIAHLRGDNLQR